MIEDIDQVTISSCRDERFKLEQNLALDLLEVFDKEENNLIGPLRVMAKKALEEMDTKPANVVDQACKDENLLSIWGVWGSLHNIGKNWRHLTASNCSDVIRLYGRVAEIPTVADRTRAQARGTRPRTQMDTLKDTYRPGGDMVWGQHGRVRHAPAQSTPQWQRQWEMPAAVHGIDFKQAGQTTIFAADQRGFVMPVTLISTVRKIDNAFGLPVGADISGTTADSIFFVERFARRCAGELRPYYPHDPLHDPIYQLLALATLVSARHHALVESAMTMTLNGLISYSIGSYDTLLPDGSDHPAKGAIQGVLNEANSHPWNRHILAYFDQNRMLHGGYEFTGEHLSKYRKLATINKDLFWLFTTMPLFPTKGRIRMFMSSHGLT